MQVSVFEKKNEMLLRLFFGQNVPTTVNIRQIEDYKQKATAFLEVLEGIELSIHQCEPKDPNLKYSNMTIQYGKMQAEATIRWCEECIRQLKTEAINEFTQ